MKWLLCLTISFLLAGCATPDKKPPPPPTVKTVYVYADCGPKPERTPVDFRGIDWLVGNDLICLDPLMFQDFSYNNAVGKSAVKELKAEIQYYRACLDRQKDLTEESSDGNQ